MPLKKKNRRTQKNNINKRVQKMTKRKSLGKNTRKNLRKKKKPGRGDLGGVVVWGIV